MSHRNRKLHPLTEDDLIGAWEAFNGDGVHGWSYNAMVFERDEGGLIIKYWSPGDAGPSGEWRNEGSSRVMCVAEGIDLKLIARNGSEHCSLTLCPEGNGAFARLIDGTTAGIVYFRRMKRWKKRLRKARK